jgi:membrane protease subunit (stomatin/prohibitin family)
MAVARQVITALNRNGTDLLGMKNVAVKIPDESIVSGSLLTVESNHFCVLKSRGAVLNVYDTGQYALVTPDKPIIGAFVQGFFSGASPWQYEVIYVNRAKLLVRNRGLATTREMAEVSYQVDYYIHVDSKEDALDLTTHLPFSGVVIDTEEIAAYAGPAIEQAINAVVQVTPLERINEHIAQLLETVKGHLSDFLRVYGITLNDLKVLVLPKDERMRELISLQALGLSAQEAIRYYLALKMADQGLLSAPNAAVGAPFVIGGATLGTFPLQLGAGTPQQANPPDTLPPNSPWGTPSTDREG